MCYIFQVWAISVGTEAVAGGRADVQVNVTAIEDHWENVGPAASTRQTGMTRFSVLVEHWPAG